MNRKHILEVIKQAKAESKPRNFKQTYDLIINLKNLDLKNPAQQLDFFVTLPHPKGKLQKVCALVGPELADEARKYCTTTIIQDEFDAYQKDKKKIKKLAEEHDWFIAQANIMAKVAQVFGSVLGPRGKMPNPKAGCVVPPKASLGPLVEKLQKTVHVKAKDKNSPVVHLSVGREDMPDEEVAENIATLYDQVLHHLPGEHNNIKSVFLKLTMGKPVKMEQ
ncbi:50S ribosomal protein L1 [Candidatus Woesearchaeota archaeon]|nr:MAG: 50S ribosomal protein L1 [Candidatus Woesearchaeota archaeon]